MWMCAGVAATATDMLPQVTISYNPVLSGVADPQLRQEIEKSAVVFSKQPYEVLTIAALKSQLAEDMDTVLKLLNKKGYYGAQLDYSLNLSTQPITVNFMVDPGQVYTIIEFSISATDMNNVLVNHISMDLGTIGIQLGEPANMDKVRAAVKKLFVILSNKGYPYAKIQHEQATVDHDKKGLKVILFLNTGKIMHFGQTHFNLAPGMDEKFITNRLQWKEGDVFSNTKVMQTVEVLNNTHLYSFVKISRTPTPPPDTKVPITIEAAPAHPKKFGWNFSYDGTLKFNGEVGWKGSNVLEDGDFLQVLGNVGEHKTGLSFEHIVPDILWPESTMTTKLAMAQIKWKAYSRFMTTLSTVIASPIVGKLMGFVGYNVSLSTIKPRSGGDSHSPIVLALPMGVYYNDFDDPRLPRKGWNAQLDIYPSMIIAPNQYFFQASLQQSFLIPLDESKKLVFSGWYNVGLSPGVGKGVLPRDKLYYVGGYGTVRGYGSQMAGPLDSAGNPTGGRSMLALGMALSYYLNPDLSFEGFVDAGSAFDTPYPNFAHRYFLGIGAGLKYKTLIGDLHFDVAFPINRRPQDEKAQIYFGIGQPF